MINKYLHKRAQNKINEAKILAHCKPEWIVEEYKLAFQNCIKDTILMVLIVGPLVYGIAKLAPYL